MVFFEEENNVRDTYCDLFSCDFCRNDNILKRGKNMKFFNEEIKPINNNCWTNCDDCENCDGCISCDYLPE